MKKEITFIVHEAEEGGYNAESIGVGIFAEGEKMVELKENIRSGVNCFFDSPEETPAFAHLHFVQDEVFAF